MKYYRLMTEDEIRKLQDGHLIKDGHPGSGIVFLGETFSLEHSNEAIGRMYIRLKKELNDPAKICEKLEEFTSKTYCVEKAPELLYNFAPTNCGVLVEFENHSNELEHSHRAVPCECDGFIILDQYWTAEYSARTMHPTRYCDYTDADFSNWKLYDQICNADPYYGEYDSVARFPRAKRFHKAS